MSKVTDPALLAELEGTSTKVTDPALLAQLEGTPPPKAQPASVLKRAAAGIADPGIGIAQIADKLIVNPIRQLVSPGASSMDDYVRERERGLQADGVDWARMGGNVASPASWVPSLPAVTAAARAAAALRTTALPTVAAGGAATRGAAAGAAQSAMSPTTSDDFWTEKAKQVGIGAGTGAVLSKAIAGLQGTPEARVLMDRGIQPTVGQSLGGMANRAEQKLTSVPFVGDAIGYARNRAQKEFEAAAVREATGGPPLGFTGNTLDEANNFASALYDRVVPNLKPTMEAVVNVQAAVRNAMQNPEMTDQSKQMLAGIVQKHGQNFGQLSGEGIKKLDSEMGHLARKYAAGDPASKTLAGELWNVQAALREGLEHGLPSDLQGILRQANTTWRNLIPLNKAASARADEHIMPRALQRAMARQQRKDVTMANIDPLVDNAVAVLPSTVPDSGTAGRLMFGLGGLGAASASGTLLPVLGAGAAAGLGATRPVQQAIMGNTPMQRAMQPFSAELASMLAAALRGQNNE